MTLAAQSDFEPLRFWPTLGSTLLGPFKRSGPLLISLGILLPACVAIANVYFRLAQRYRDAGWWTDWGLYLIVSMLVTGVLFLSQSAVYRSSQRLAAGSQSPSRERFHFARGLLILLLMAFAWEIPVFLVTVAAQLLGIATIQPDFASMMEMDRILYPEASRTALVLNLFSHELLREWLAQACVTIGICCFIAGRLATLAPSAFLDERRKTIEEAWRDTRGQGPRLCALFVCVHGISLGIAQLLAFISQEAVELWALRVLSYLDVSLSGSLVEFIQVAYFSIGYLAEFFRTLWWASLCLIVYRWAERRRIAVNVAAFD